MDSILMLQKISLKKKGKIPGHIVGKFKKLTELSLFIYEHFFSSQSKKQNRKTLISLRQNFIRINKHLHLSIRLHHCFQELSLKCFWDNIHLHG